MAAREQRELPADLARGKSRFQAWRGGRKGGGRIPQSLWALAVQLAKAYGISRTAATLSLDYYSLQRRTVNAADEVGAGDAAFVELPSPIRVGKECRLELDNGAGATMRVQLVGYDAADIEVLSRSLWNAL